MTARKAAEFINRETSWLEFNRRVLEEAEDARTPLLERLRFFCIFHSNLDEFFMVRVASLIQKVQERSHKRDPAGLTAPQQLEQVLAAVRSLVEESDRLFFQKLLPALSRESIEILGLDDLDPSQRAHLDGYFDREVYPVLTPVAVEEAGTFPRLAGLAVNLAVLVAPEAEEGASSRLAVVQVPARLPGLLRVPGTDPIGFCWLPDLIRARLGSLFPGYRIVDAAPFRLTRDSELELDDEGYGDYMQMLEGELARRRQARPVRLECAVEAAQELVDRIQGGLGVDDSLLLRIRGPLDPRPLMSIVDMSGFAHLRYPPQPPLLHPMFEQQRDLYELIRESDILHHHPYDSFDPVQELIERAADDPDVLAIKQTLYRSSGQASPVVGALIRAAESGKQVTVLVELMARFDEERNIGWARDLEQAGAHVIYGLMGLKVHSKITLIVRREPEGIRRYVHLGTGNYNERTARVYTDTGLLTAAEEIGSDASGFFNTITGFSEPPAFQRLIMAPGAIRQAVLAMIRREIDRRQGGQSAGITAKMNSLADPEIIEELYRASGAGVSVRLNVRGICCLRPSVPGLSENIRVISIVDRYLEHSRICVFNNGGREEVYLSSADWMPRNLDRRVELMFPVIQQHCKDSVIRDLEAQFADNQKARFLKADGTYARVPAGRAGPFRAQNMIYTSRVEEHARLRQTTPVRFVPLEGH